MPTIAENPEMTATAKDIIEKTTTALADAGLTPSGTDEPSLDQEFDAAYRKDQNLEPVGSPQSPTSPKPPVGPKPASSSPLEAPSDIPEAAIKPPEKKAPDATEAQKEAAREKEIAENTKGLSPKAADRFRAIEKRAHEAEALAAKIPTLEAELTKLKAAPTGNKEEIESLQKKIDELDAIVQKNALIEHPKFKEHYDGAIDKEIERVKAFSGDHADEIAGLLRLPESKQRNERLAEIIAELDQIPAAKLVAAVDRVDRLVSEKATELNNWKENKLRMANLEQQSFQERTQAGVAALGRAVEATLLKVSDAANGLELFRQVDGNPAWNSTVQQRIESARRMAASDVSPEMIAELSVAAVVAPEYRKLYLSQREFNQKLKEEITRLTGAEPDIKPGDTKPGETGDEKLSFIDSVLKASKEAGFIQ